MTDTLKQLNPFEIKTIILNIISKFSNIDDLGVLKNLDISILDAQNDKKTIQKVLFKELNNAKPENEHIIRVLLERFAVKEELTAHLWTMLKSNIVANETKIVALNFLRDLDSSWSYEECGSYLNNPDELIDSDTKFLLKNAIINPEVQIDFLDFMNSLTSKDKIMLIQSLGNDYSEDALANILIPVFLADPSCEEATEALEILGGSKSQLAYHALNSAYEYVDDNIKPLVKKNLSKLKLSGIREDNSHEFYKKLLINSKPYKFCATYPDGHGNQALIFTRQNSEERIQFVAVVIDDYKGVKDCFGFNDISKFECDKIIERFYNEDTVLNLSPSGLKTILQNAEKLSKKFPYEYICWKNLLADIETDHITIKEILSNNLSPGSLEENDVKKLETDEFTLHWFLDYSYSDEFDQMIDRLNIKLQTPANKTDFEEIAKENLHKIFYPEERRVWGERLLMSSYLKLLTRENETAQRIYSLYFDEKAKDEFFTNIIRKSIYEYYFTLKYNTELNNGKFSLNELDYIIKLIESKWVKNV